jgi:hypothetical protein
MESEDWIRLEFVGKQFYKETYIKAITTLKCSGLKTSKIKRDAPLGSVPFGWACLS